MRIEEAKDLLNSIPRVSIGFFPTPLQRLDSLSEEYGVEFFMKRDDLSGPEFGGNKIRKLEYLLADAVREGCDHVFTFGAHQSNHARETAAACRKCGLQPVLYLTKLGNASGSEEILGNLLLDHVLGADVHCVSPAPGLSAYEAVVHSQAAASEHAARLERSGHRCYMVPVGGFNPTGCLGFAAGLVELIAQARDIGAEPDYIMLATGSGGTLAGMLAGKRLLGAHADVLGFSVDAEPDGKKQTIAETATNTLALLDICDRIDPREVFIDSSYYGEGYEIPSRESTSALLEVARREGIILDPVYTAKAMAGTLDYIRTGKIASGKTVVFWHTGGTPATFAEPEIAGVCDAI